jgi:hypothetical protein
MKTPNLAVDIFARDLVLAQRSLALGWDWLPLAAADKRHDLYRQHGVLQLFLPAPGLKEIDELCLLARNQGATPLLAGLTLCHASQAKSFSGGRAVLVPGGWQELRFPAEDFGTFGRVGGAHAPAPDWSQVRELHLTLAGEKGAPPPEIRVRLGALSGRSRQRPPGPRLRPQGLADLLAQRTAGVGFCYGPDHPGAQVPPPHNYEPDTMAGLLAGRVLGQAAGFPWSWDANPPGDLEWPHFLHRHHCLRPLALASPGDRKLGQALAEALTTWIVAHPVPLDSNGGASPAWETLSVAWRLREWLWIRGLAWEVLDQPSRDLFLCSVWEHARHLLDHRGHPNNWALVEAAALSLAGICFPEFREAAGWWREGLARLGQEARRQSQADGSQVELSPLYQAVGLHALLETRLAVRAAGLRFPRPAEAALRRGLAYLAALARPDFSWPALNDSWGARGDYTRLLAWAGRDFQQPHWTWLGSRGRQGSPPPEGPRHFRQAGMALLRAGDDGNAPWLLLRAGPPGLTHAHQDALSLEVFSQVPRLVDPGITSYAPGPLTEHYRAAAAHNLPLLDGQGPRADEEGPRLHCRGHVRTALARGHWPGRGHCLRQVALLGDDCCLIRDAAWGLVGDHCLSIGWQCFPGAWTWDAEQNQLRGDGDFSLRLLTAWPPGALSLVSGQEHPPRGWVSLEGRDQPAPHLRLELEGSSFIQAIWLACFRRRWEARVLEGAGSRPRVLLEAPDEPGLIVAWSPPESPGLGVRTRPRHKKQRSDA